MTTNLNSLSLKLVAASHQGTAALAAPALTDLLPAWTIAPVTPAVTPAGHPELRQLGARLRNPSLLQQVEGAFFLALFALFLLAAAGLIVEWLR